MKQIMQNLKTGKTELVEVPWPAIKVGHLLIQSCASLVSADTERMLIHRLPQYHLPELPQYDLPDLPQRNRLHPRGIGYAFHGVNIPQARQGRQRHTDFSANLSL